MLAPKTELRFCLRRVSEKRYLEKGFKKQIIRVTYNNIMQRNKMRRKPGLVGATPAVTRIKLPRRGDPCGRPDCMNP